MKRTLPLIVLVWVLGACAPTTYWHHDANKSQPAFERDDAYCTSSAEANVAQPIYPDTSNYYEDGDYPPNIWGGLAAGFEGASDVMAVATAREAQVSNVRDYCLRELGYYTSEEPLKRPSTETEEDLYQIQNTPNPLIMVFGGEDHDVFLGCLSCSEFDTDSIMNEFGSYGSEFQTNSVHNDFSDYGSEYSNLSACNPYANDPPVIVDENGDFYGRLTLNEFHPEAAEVPAITEWLETVPCG